MLALAVMTTEAINQRWGGGLFCLRSAELGSAVNQTESGLTANQIPLTLACLFLNYLSTLQSKKGHPTSC